MFLALFTYQQVNQFDKVHILTIAICFLCFFLIPFFGKKLNTNKRRVASASLIFIGLLQEVFDYGNRIYFNGEITEVNNPGLTRYRILQPNDTFIYIRPIEPNNIDSLKERIALHPIPEEFTRLKRRKTV